MQIVKVTCPNCKAVLSVKNSQNEAEKNIACPNCQSKLRVRFPQQPAADEGKTVIGGKDMPTQAVYMVRCEGQSYELKDGVNTIGRKAAMSQASVQIATDKLRMSRNHARIEVLRLTGGQARLRISNWQNSNPTHVNGVLLKDGETLILKEGYEIKMGDAQMTIERKL